MHLNMMYVLVCVCAVKVGGQLGCHGLLGEGWRTGHPEPNGGSERREGGGPSLEGEDEGEEGRARLAEDLPGREEGESNKKRDKERQRQ